MQAARTTLLRAHRPCEPRRLPCVQRSSRARQQCRVRAQESEGEPDWDKELQVFKQRTLKPNQLEVQRKIAAANVDVGRVRQEGCKRGLPPLAPPPAAAPAASTHPQTHHQPGNRWC